MSGDLVEIRTACHRAMLDPMIGSGMLVLPDPYADVAFGTDALHGSDWNHMIRKLREVGWEPLEDERDDGTLTVGVTVEGREVIALVTDNPIIDRPSIEDEIAAADRLRDAVALVVE